MFTKNRIQSTPPSLRVRTQIKAGAPGRLAQNRCEELGSPKALQVRTQIKAGGSWQNRCEALAQV